MNLQYINEQIHMIVTISQPPCHDGYDMCNLCISESDYEEREMRKQRRIDENKIKHPKWGMNKPKYRR